jgi:DNA-directed RNA polymerase subunit RPC12/RpoP
MKTVNAIMFYCPNCNQHFQSESLGPGQDFQCTECAFKFKIPADPTIEAVIKPEPAAPQTFTLPPIEESGVATALAVIAGLEFVAAPLAGLAFGSDNAQVGWLIFLSGIISGLILLGFARVIQHTSESSQRLRRIEMLIQRGQEDKNDA